MKKLFSIIMSVAMLLSFSACAVPNMADTSSDNESSTTNVEIEQNDEEETVTTEETLTICIDYAMKSEMESITEYYSKSSGSTINIEFLVLSNDDDEKELQISQIQTEIMSGFGPDLFVLYSNNPKSESQISLFSNMDKSIYSNIFYDMNSLIESDSDFDLSDYNQTVISAGQTDEGFYAFPLFYSFPTFFIGDECEIPSEDVNLYTIENISDDYLRSSFSSMTRYYFSSIIPQIIDYDSEEILISQEEFTALIEKVQDLKQYNMDYRETTEEELMNHDLDYLASGYSIQNAFSWCGEADVLVPLYNTDGSITASVITYSAINRNTEFCDECFEIIKILLDENIQAGLGITYDEKYYSANYYISSESIPVNNNAVVTMMSYGLINSENLTTQLLDCIDEIEYASFLNDIDRLIFDSLVWQDEVDTEYLYKQINTLIHE
ncbi:MAG: hypothetical protein R3Y35_12270 [Clostridia bacterium]